MRYLRQVIWGIVTALISAGLLMGGFSLSLAEGSLPLPAATLAPAATITSTATLPPVESPSRVPPIVTPTLPATGTPSLSPTTSPTMPPPPTNCPPPTGWLPYVVQPGDTLSRLAMLRGTTSTDISTGNCLATNGLISGQVIYLPPLPTSSPVACGAPHNWVIYIVQRGDTLFHLGQAFGIPYTEIKRANCLTSSIIHIGQSIYVPPWATRTPSPTPTLFFDTPTETASVDPFLPTDTPTETPY
jgi:LysM repeat protein